MWPCHNLLRKMSYLYISAETFKKASAAFFFLSFIHPSWAVVRILPVTFRIGLYCQTCCFVWMDVTGSLLRVSLTQQTSYGIQSKSLPNMLSVTCVMSMMLHSDWISHFLVRQRPVKVSASDGVWSRTIHIYLFKISFITIRLGTMWKKHSVNPVSCQNKQWVSKRLIPSSCRNCESCNHQLCLVI